MEQSMKRVWQGVLLLVLAFAGVNAASAGQLKLNSGKSIELLDAREAETPGGKALVLEYQTRISLDDLAALNKEADELWEKFVVEAERGKYQVATISAHAPDKGDTAAKREPFDTVYEKINGAWRTRLHPAGKAVPLTEAIIREFIDRQASAIEHNNTSALLLSTAKDWIVIVVDAESPNVELVRMNLDEFFAATFRVQSLAEDFRFQYEIVDISVDRAAGTARVETRGTEKLTMNGIIFEVTARYTDFVELRDGIMLATRTHIVIDEMTEFRTN